MIDFFVILVYYVNVRKVIIMRKIGIMLGVFNPPHNFHFTIANEILKNNPDIEKIIFVPTNDNYKKPDVINSEHRFNMLKLVCSQNKQFDVSRFEIDSLTQPYSEETLEHFAKVYPEYKINLIIGSDNLKTFNTWHNYSNILKKYSPIIFERDDDNLDLIIENTGFLKPYKYFIKSSKCSISSDLSATKVRNRIKNKQSITDYVPIEINDYIKTHKLYLSN